MTYLEGDKNVIIYSVKKDGTSMIEYKVLIVDDEDEIREAIEIYLKMKV